MSIRDRPSRIRCRRSGRTFASRWTVATAYAAGGEVERGQDRRAFARDRREPEARVRHHVADDLGPAAHALAAEDVARALVRCEQERGDPVDLHPVVLLRHRQVPASQPGLDVGDRGVAGRPRPRQRRVGVAVDEHVVRPLGPDDRRDPCAHPLDVGRVEIERVGRRWQVELVEEHLRELAVVVLTRVDDDLLDATVA
jgi:hypothetical protein